MHNHKCAVPGCELRIRVDMLMCLNHWRMVPAPIRAEIMGEWRSGSRTCNYFRAVQAALQSIRSADAGLGV